MLKKILIVFSLAVPGLLFSQKMKRCVVASSYFSGQGTNLKIRATAAQPPNVGTVSNATNSLRQGFQQPIPSNLDCPVPSASMTFLSNTVSCNEIFSFFYTGQNVPGLSFLWEFGTKAVPQTSTVANPNNVVFFEPGVQDVVLTVTLDGCSSKSHTDVTTAFTPLVTEVANQSNISCFGEEDGAIELNIIGGEAPYSVLWNTGETGTMLNNLAGGVYSYSLMDASNCLFESEVEIENAAEISINTIPIPESCDNTSDGSIKTEITGGKTPYLIVWSTGEAGDSITTLSSGTYALTVNDANGCSATQNDIEVGVLCNEELNNFVTPNGDGYNDIWILPINSYDRVGMRIYNRYGGIVYKNERYQNDWSGQNTAGDPLPPGAYFFALDFEKAGEITVEKGALTLLR